MQAIVWSTSTCSFCKQAKALLDKYNIPYEERLIGDNWTKEQLLEVVPNARTVPQIFIDGNYVGGYTDLVSHLSGS
jgi:glutaredoxin 3